MLLSELGQFLVDQRAAGHLALLVIDEAQNLTLPALEEIRMLSNLETEKSKLMQIILIGQPDLRDMLRSAGARAAAPARHGQLPPDPLDAEETATYINHRLQPRRDRGRRSSSRATSPT